MESLPVLAFDTGSPVTSVAAAVGGRILAQRSCEQRRSSGVLLGLADEVLAEAGVSLGELGGLLALRGPGSFTGLRVGLATVLGLHQATRIPATALPTLEVLAAAAPAGRRSLAVVDALRGAWFAQLFRSGLPPEPLSTAERLPAGVLGRMEAELVIGFGAESLEEPAEAPTVTPPLLAGVAAAAGAKLVATWDSALLIRPLYLQPPRVAIPGPPKPVLGDGGS